MSGEYSVVFTGNILEGLDKNLVINNIVAKTKLSVEQVIRLFETAPKAIKKFDSNEDANRLVSSPRPSVGQNGRRDTLGTLTFSSSN